MHLHSNASLTVSQRRAAKRLYESGAWTRAQLARRYSVSWATIERWVKRDSPLDKSVPVRAKRVVTPEYEQAVTEYRKEHPHHGAIRIALGLQEHFSFAHRGTVALILKRHGLTRKKAARPKPKGKISVGRPRMQMDIKQLPAVKGGQGFEYKISLIHLRTRWKYSEIHGNCCSATVSAVYQRALDNLPPFS